MPNRSSTTGGELLFVDSHEINGKVLREYTPFEVYACAMHELFRRQEGTDQDWLSHQSRIYPTLDRYQKDAFHQLLRIAGEHGGAFLCDGVGLGKTLVGLMLIEYLIEKKRKRVALFVPRADREAVWEGALKARGLNHLADDAFSNLVIFNHTDLQRGGRFPDYLYWVQDMADVVLIDEAHHFRNPGYAGTGRGRPQACAARKPSRYQEMFNLIGGPDGVKQVFLLTATPVNNRLADFQHMIALFSRHQADYFKKLGILSLPGHFRKLENALLASGSVNGDSEPGTDSFEAESVLAGDVLFRSLVVQRSRAYVRRSQLQQNGTAASFPSREPPIVAGYKLRTTYGKLLDKVDRAFGKETPLFSLAVYYPLAYYKVDSTMIDPTAECRQKQVVGLIRTEFLKRFESSAHTFACSCEWLLRKLLAFATRHSETAAEKKRLEDWHLQNKALTDSVYERPLSLLNEDEAGNEPDEDIFTAEMLADVEYLPRAEYEVEEMLAETFLDLDQIAEFLAELRQFEPRHDDKLQSLVQLLQTDAVAGRHKVLIFTEFAETARYLKQQLTTQGLRGVEQIDSATQKNLADIVCRFAPYYNGSSSPDLAADGQDEIRILIATDVLSEGLNLQDATRFINYDLHWNSVRLMQRIGRMDRRLDPSIEARLSTDHPDQKPLRGQLTFWNFLPPDELDDLLRFYSRVNHKALHISRTFGIEGQRLLRPEDELEALKNFNRRYEGEATQAEQLQLEYQRLLKDHPDLEKRLTAFPDCISGGKQHTSAGTHGVFFCFTVPRPDHDAALDADGKYPWTEEAGRAAWYYYDLNTGDILEDPVRIVEFIRCQPDSPRHSPMAGESLSEVRDKVEQHIQSTYLKSVQAPAGVLPVLKAWMELT